MQRAAVERNPHQIKISILCFQVYRIVFAICHMFAMSSACSNPILYGWLNNNFNSEFRELFQIASNWCLPAFVSRRTQLARNPSSQQMPSVRAKQTNLEFSQISAAAERTGVLPITTVTGLTDSMKANGTSNIITITTSSTKSNGHLNCDL